MLDSKTVRFYSNGPPRKARVLTFTAVAFKVTLQFNLFTLIYFVYRSDNAGAPVSSQPPHYIQKCYLTQESASFTGTESHFNFQTKSAAVALCMRRLKSARQRLLFWKACAEAARLILASWTVVVNCHVSIFEPLSAGCRKVSWTEDLVYLLGF